MPEDGCYSQALKSEAFKAGGGNPELNTGNVDDGNARGRAFLPTPEMQPKRLPYEPRYRFEEWIAKLGGTADEIRPFAISGAVFYF